MQGMISVVRHGEVTVKVIAGSNGANISRMASWLRGELRKGDLPGLRSIYNKALSIPFGTEADLVVMDGEEAVHGVLHRALPSYFETFADPLLNPRCQPTHDSLLEVIETS